MFLILFYIFSDSPEPSYPKYYMLLGIPSLGFKLSLVKFLRSNFELFVVFGKIYSKYFLFYLDVLIEEKIMKEEYIIFNTKNKTRIRTWLGSDAK